MRNFKKIIWIVVFCCLVVLANFILNFALVPYSYTRVKIHNANINQYYDVIVGSSHGLSAIDPEVIERINGRKAINLCLGGEYMMDAYHLVKEACKNGMPKRVIYELDPGYWCSAMHEDMEYSRIFNEMPFSMNKVEYFFAKMMRADFRTGIFQWYQYRKHYKAIPAIVNEKLSDDYKNYGVDYFKSDGQFIKDNGFIYINTIENSNKSKDNLILWNEDELNKEVDKYFKKLVKYCKKNDIELVVVTTPVPDETLEEYPDEFAKANEFFTNYMEEQGVKYLNFNYMDVEGLDTGLNAFSDYEGHMFGETAQVFTRILYEYLDE